MDIRTIIKDGRGEWLIDAPGLATDAGLDTAIIISLFTDRRAEADDEIPDGSDNRGGWWGDAVAEISGDRIGSRLWLLSRSKLTDETLRKCEEYALESLQWLISDGVAVGLQAVASRLSTLAAGIEITIQRPKKGPVKYRFTQYWEG